jgi:transcriptional regulator with XRE-family HTH domain
LVANERLRRAITQAGLDTDQLAVLADVDVRTVYRWVAGRIPYARHRAKLTEILGREEHELWPEVGQPSGQDVRAEILGAWAHANDLGAPDWRALLKDAVEQIDLLGYALLDILQSPGVTDLLRSKAASGCQVRILIPAADSVFLDAAAHELGRDEQDYIGRTQLQREIELTRAYLEPLLGTEAIDAWEYYADRAYTILRSDDQMLLALALHGTPSATSPLVQLRRRAPDGLFDQLATHLDQLAAASQPLEPHPGLYPDPGAHPDRYQPTTRETYQQQLQAARQATNQSAETEPPLGHPPTILPPAQQSGTSER